MGNFFHIIFILPSIFAKLTSANVALGKTASQSSTSIYNNPVASKAVDGNLQQTHAHCTRTNEEYQPWWRVDLGASMTVRSVRIYTRSDKPSRLNYAKVIVSNNLNNIKNVPVCKQLGVASHYMDVTCSSPRVGRYVQIQLPSRGTLSLCEVQVIADTGDSSGSCKDVHNMCPRYKRYCGQDKYKKWLMKNCKRTCGWCGSVAPTRPPTQPPVVPQTRRPLPPKPGKQNNDEIIARQRQNQWFKDGKTRIDQILGQQPINKKAKGTILVIGDGMGPSTVTAARIYDGQSKGMKGEENILSWELFPNTAFSKTYNTDHMVPDSAGTATAYLTGVKTNKGIVGVDERATYENCRSSQGHEVLSLLMMAELQGLSTGVVTTTRVTHASPSAAYAHSATRNWESSAPAGCRDIATQAVHFNAGDGLEVLLGGGREKFLPSNVRDPEYTNRFGKREDGKNLIEEWKAKSDGTTKYEFVWNKADLLSRNPKDVDHIMGLFEPFDLKFEHERQKLEPNTEPSLTEMVEFAVKVLEKNSKGYVLFVEGGKIDHAHHKNQAHLAMSETQSLANTVQKLSEITKEEEVMIIVTADHSHVMTIAGYTKRGFPVTGLADNGGT